MELKDCPFCGGKAYRVYGGDDEKPIEYVMCTSCHAMTEALPTVEEVAERWNRREERTCRIIEDMCGLAHCSECGYEFYPYDCSGIPEEGVPYEYDGRYCKNCGARVVNE